MIEDIINPKRIRDKAPYRKSMSLTEEDLMRASELERIFNSKFTSESPFNFSKTVSKALELAILQMLHPVGPSGLEQETGNSPGTQKNANSKRLKRLQNTKRSF